MTRLLDARRVSLELEEIILELRLTLLNQSDFVFGALFVANRHTGESGLVFAENMTQEQRMQMLDDLQLGIDAARKRFQQ